MKAKGWLATGLLVLGAAACGGNPAEPNTPVAGPRMDGGGLMGSGARIDAPPPPGGSETATPDSIGG